MKTQTEMELCAEHGWTLTPDGPCGPATAPPSLWHALLQERLQVKELQAAIDSQREFLERDYGVQEITALAAKYDDAMDLIKVYRVLLHAIREMGHNSLLIGPCEVCAEIIETVKAYTDDGK